MTMGQRLMLKKQTQLKADPSINKLRVAMLGQGEVFGTEECLNEEPLRRQHTVVCNKKDSEIWFIPFVDFRERIIGDEKVQDDIDADNSFKKLFYKFRKERIKFLVANPDADLLFSNGDDQPQPMRIKDYFKT